MLNAVRRDPLLVETAQVLVDAVRYLAVLLIVIVLLGRVAELAS
jgi:hypothetical protein